MLKYLNWNIIIKKLILNDNSFGIYVTQDNIETVLRKEKEYLQKYIREHKKEIDTFRSYEYRDMYTEYVTICE